MKKKLIALLLIGVLGLAMTACGDNDAQSVLETSGSSSPAESAQEPEEQIEIPEAVANISPEDDKALTGVLTEDSYTNEYFGLKLNKIEGGSIESIMDDGTDIASLSQAYADGIGSIMIVTHDADYTGTISMFVSALTSEEQGKSEEELLQEKVEMEGGINEGLGYEAGGAVETVSLAGEEYPAYIESYSDEETNTKTAALIIVKNDFVCNISIYGHVEIYDELFKYFEKS